MTSTRQHIEDLDIGKWATMAHAAATESLETSRRLGLRPRPETVALAAMTEVELTHHRTLNGATAQRRSPAMQLVEADRRSRFAERRADEAHQGRLDAEAAAAMARAEADESARAATAARERLRAVEVESAEKDRRRSQERAADRQAQQSAAAEAERIRADAAAEAERIRTEVTSELERVRADAAAEAAAADERVRAAERRAEQRATERAAERGSAEQAALALRGELEQVRADAAAEVAAAGERVRAAEQRAEQRATERAAERAAGEETVAQLRGELERVRADAATEVAAARGQASGEVAAARQAAAAEVAAARQAAQAEIDRARSHAEDLSRQAQAELARSMARASASGMLTIPIAPAMVRSHIMRIEEVLDVLYQIDYVLEIGMTVKPPPEVAFVRSLTQRVQERVKHLSDELGNLHTRFTDPLHAEAAISYANAAGEAYTALLARMEAAVQRQGDPHTGPVAEISAEVLAMLADPWIQALRQPPA